MDKDTGVLLLFAATAIIFLIYFVDICDIRLRTQNFFFRFFNCRRKRIVKFLRKAISPNDRIVRVKKVLITPGLQLSKRELLLLFDCLSPCSSFSEAHVLLIKRIQQEKRRIFSEKEVGDILRKFKQLRYEDFEELSNALLESLLILETR